MVEILLGDIWDTETGDRLDPVVVDLESNLLINAPPGAGKGVTLEMLNLLSGLRDASVLSVDPSGQNAAVCAEARRKMGHDVLCLNPFGLHVKMYPDLQSVGFNPLANIDPRSPLFYQACAAIGEALIKLENDSQRHFPESAQGTSNGTRHVGSAQSAAGQP